MDSALENNKTTNSSFIERLADKLGVAAKASTIFGEPIEREGITVIPVAKAKFGFGGGSGNKAGEEGLGGGGGMAIMPIGYIEIKNESSKFYTLSDPERTLKIVAVSGLFAFLTIRSIVKLLQS